jgi:hypothetical protein
MRQKVENLAHAVSLHYMHYNFARPHKTLTKVRNGYPTTPAMAAGVADRVWTLAEIAGLLDQPRSSCRRSRAKITASCLRPPARASAAGSRWRAAAANRRRADVLPLH